MNSFPTCLHFEKYPKIAAPNAGSLLNPHAQVAWPSSLTWHNRRFLRMMLLIGVFLILAPAASAQVAFDAASSNQTNNAGASSMTFSHTTSGSNRFMVLGVSLDAGASQTNQVTSATYGSQSLTFIGSRDIAGVGGMALNLRIEMWGLVAPNTGTNTVTVNLSASVRFVSGAITLTGVNQSGVNDANSHTAFVSNAGNNATTATLTVNSATDDVVVDILGLNDPSNSDVTNLAMTERWEQKTNRISGTGATTTGSATTNLSWSITGGTNAYAIGAISFRSTGPTLATLKSFQATRLKNGAVALQWHTGYEVNNLGFNLYRESKGERTRVNSQVIAGSALLAGGGTILQAGQSYNWRDSSPPTGEEVTYWLEDIDLDGTKTMSGPILPEATGFEGLPQKNAPLLNMMSAERVDVGHPYLPSISVFSKKPAKRALKVKGAPQPAGTIKMVVREEGWYRVSFSELFQAGLDPKANPTKLQLFVGGQEVPMLVSTNSTSGGIEFYGQGQDALYTSSRTYWLVVGQQSGKRISRLLAPAQPAPTASFNYTVELKERIIYFAALRNGDQENFFGRVITSTPVAHQLQLSNLDANYDSLASVQVSLQGVTESAAPNDHTVSVLVNDTPVGVMQFDGQQRVAKRFEFSHSLLHSGDNFVTLKSEGGASDISIVDFIRLTYRHTAVADGDALAYIANAREAQTISGFTNPLIRIFDISNPANPVEFAGTISDQGQTFSVSVSSPSNSLRTLLALTDERIKRPASIIRDQASTLQNRQNQADMVILSHRDFIPALATLKARREAQGLKVAVIDLEDVYDEFSFGDKSVHAIKAFLSATKLWERAPRFVLLVGDASLDPKNYLSATVADFSPTKFVDTELFETVTDDWIADFNNDGISDLAIGRLPVRTAAEASAVITKILSYEEATAAPQAALLVADRNDGYNFEKATDDASALLPAATQVQKLFRSQISDAQAHTDILAAIEQGVSLFNYAGHGANELLRGNLLTNSDAAQMTNSRLPIFVMMSCLNGYFQTPEGKSLAEALLMNSRGGAIAVWASSGLTEPHGQALINQELYRQIFGAAKDLRLGEAVAKAKQATAAADIRSTWILFGDPSLRVK